MNPENPSDYMKKPALDFTGHKGAAQRLKARLNREIEKQKAEEKKLEGDSLILNRPLPKRGSL